MKDEKIRFAVLGCGRISDCHLIAIKNAHNAELAAVCDIDEAKAKQAAFAHGLTRWYVSFDKMLSCEDIDVVNICTPSGLHCEHVVTAAKAKKHVLCEKPLDITKEKLDMMINTCKQEGVYLGGIFQRRTAISAINARNVIREGRLGKIVMASAYLKYYRSQEYYNSADWRATWELDGGGALMNQGIHGIDMLSWLVGDVESVYAKCATLARKIEVEDTAVVTMKFKNGALGVVEGATSVYPGQDTIFSIHGDKGTITLGDKGFYAWDIYGSKEKAPEAGEGFGGMNCGYSSTDSGHTIQIQDMAKAVLDNKAPMIPGDEARKAVNLVLAIYESSKSNREVRL